MVNTLLMATSIGKAKGHKLLGNQCAKGRAAKVQRIFESAMTDFTEQLQCYWSQLLTVMYDRHRVGELRVPHLSVNNGYAVMLLLAEKADSHLLNECLATQRIARGLFERTSLSRKFVWRYLAYRVVARNGRLISILRTLVNFWYTLVKRVKYVKKVSNRYYDGTSALHTDTV